MDMHASEVKLARRKCQDYRPRDSGTDENISFFLVMTPDEETMHASLPASVDEIETPCVVISHCIFSYLYTTKL